MASGYGANGGTGRCYGLWLDFTKCLADADFPSQCKDFRDDYIECLHHGKELKRRRAIAAEINRQQKAKATQPSSDPIPSSTKPS